MNPARASAGKLSKVSGPQADVAADERAIRIELAAAYRVAALLGWSELIYAHITARLPGPEPLFLINPYGLRWDEVTASNLVKIDVDGRVVGEGVANQAGFIIHSAVHMGRADAHWIFHTHTLAGMAVSTQACGLLPIHMYAHNFYESLAYHDYEGPSMRLGERERLVRSLGESMPAAWIRMWRLERACQIQLAAQAGGRLIEPAKEVCLQSQALGEEFLTDAAPLGELEFAALRRVVDARDAGYRN